MIRILLLIFLTIFISGCDPYESPLKEKVRKHEILVYCGITMSDAIFELIDKFKTENDCDVQVMYGASGYLKHVVQVNRKGDIFFPGNVSYIDSFKTDYVVTRVEDIGYNQLSFFVAKDNPLGITGELAQLLEKNYRVAIGSKDAGAVGKETKFLLSNHGIYEKVAANVTLFSTDSKGLSAAIKDNEADIVINWLASGLTMKNKPYMTPVPIKSEFLRRVPIAMGLLKYSTEAECSNSFLDLAISSTGKDIFRKYGFTE